jgi:hypothetical protein
MSTSGSVAGRAARGVGLMFGFYPLALAIAAALVWVPVAEVIHAYRLHPTTALICIFGAGTILWSILLRWDRCSGPAVSRSIRSAQKPVRRRAGRAIPLSCLRSTRDVPPVGPIPGEVGATPRLAPAAGGLAPGTARFNLVASVWPSAVIGERYGRVRSSGAGTISIPALGFAVPAFHVSER